MGWNGAKAQALVNQHGICPICNLPVHLNGSTGHHKINRCQGGPSTVGNCEVRHCRCERYMHANYPFGNFEGDLTMGRCHSKRRRQRRPIRQDWQQEQFERIEPTVQMDNQTVTITVGKLKITIEVTT
jgi:hypothetical protein